MAHCCRHSKFPPKDDRGGCRDNGEPPETSGKGWRPQRKNCALVLISCSRVGSVAFGGGNPKPSEWEGNRSSRPLLS